MSNKKANSNKIKKNKVDKNKVEPCPCANKKEKFQDSEGSSSLLQNLNSFDDTIASFFGNSMLIIGDKSYKLKNYRWVIIVALIVFLFLLVSSFRSEPKQVVSPVVVAK